MWDEKPLDKELVARGTKYVTKGLKFSSSSLREEGRRREGGKTVWIRMAPIG